MTHFDIAEILRPLYKLRNFIYHRNMLTKSDKNWLSTNFATKDDLKGVATKNDLQRLGKKLDRKFTELFNFLDKEFTKTKGRLTTVEQILNIPQVS